MEDIRVIIIGLGHQGKGWARRVAAASGVTPVAWVDRDAGALRALADAGDADPGRCYTSLEKALTTTKADATVVVTPPFLHETHSILAMKAGLHVLCEKPLAPTMDAAQRIVDAADQAGVVFMVAQNRRHAPFIHTMRKLVREGKYGRPGQVVVAFHHHFTRDSFRDEMDHPLIVDMATHHFDMIRCVLGREPVGMMGVGWRPYWSRFKGVSSAVVTFDYDDGLRVVYEGNWHAVADLTTNGCDWRIECENGIFVCRDDAVYEAPRGGELQPVEMSLMIHQAGDYLLDEFTRCIRERRTPETSGRDNLNTLAMVFGAVRAIDSGLRV